MTTLQISSPELLSALVDGELVGSELVNPELACPELVQGISADGLYGVFQLNTLHSDWNRYQVIGQALKDGTAAVPPLGADSAFLQRLNARLASEKITPPVQFVASLDAISAYSQPAANDGVFRWKLVAGFSSLAAALVVGWNFVAAPDASSGAQLAQKQTVEQVVVASPQGPLVRDTRLEELMAAHKQLGGSSLQAPSGFLRNAGFENAQSSRR